MYTFLPPSPPLNYRQNLPQHLAISQGYLYWRGMLSTMARTSQAVHMGYWVPDLTCCLHGVLGSGPHKLSTWGTGFWTSQAVHMGYWVPDLTSCPRGVLGSDERTSGVDFLFDRWKSVLIETNNKAFYITLKMDNIISKIVRAVACGGEGGRGGGHPTIFWIL